MVDEVVAEAAAALAEEITEATREEAELAMAETEAEAAEVTEDATAEAEAAEAVWLAPAVVVNDWVTPAWAQSSLEISAALASSSAEQDWRMQAVLVVMN